MRTEADKYREAMALMAFMQECMDLFRGTGVLRELAGEGGLDPGLDIHTAINKVEGRLVGLLADQPPFQEEAIHSVDEVPGVDGPYKVMFKTPEDQVETATVIYDAPFTVEGPAGTWTFEERQKHAAKLLALRMNQAHLHGAESRDSEVERLEHKASAAGPSLRKQLASLADYIASKDLYPIPDEDHPNGISPSEAGMMVIGELLTQEEQMKQALARITSERDAALKDIAERLTREAE